MPSWQKPVRRAKSAVSAFPHFLSSCSRRKWRHVLVPRETRMNQRSLISRDLVRGFISTSDFSRTRLLASSRGHTAVGFYPLAHVGLPDDSRCDPRPGWCGLPSASIRFTPWDGRSFPRDGRGLRGCGRGDQRANTRPGAEREGTTLGRGARPSFGSGQRRAPASRNRARTGRSPALRGPGRATGGALGWPDRGPSVQSPGPPRLDMGQDPETPGRTCWLTESGNSSGSWSA